MSHHAFRAPRLTAVVYLSILASWCMLPAGALALPNEPRIVDPVEFDGVLCGFRSSVWVPGTLSPRGRFVAWSESARRLRAELSDADRSGERRIARIRIRLRILRSLIRDESLVCADGAWRVVTPAVPTPGPPVLATFKPTVNPSVTTTTPKGDYDGVVPVISPTPDSTESHGARTEDPPSLAPSRTPTPAPDPVETALPFVTPTPLGTTALVPTATKSATPFEPVTPLPSSPPLAMATSTPSIRPPGGVTPTSSAPPTYTPIPTATKTGILTTSPIPTTTPPADRAVVTIALVNTDAAGKQANTGSYAFDLSINSDGDFVAFSSSASNLVPGASNGVFNVYLKHIRTGAITRLSTDSAGNGGNANSLYPTISADGRYIAFKSAATNLHPNDSNGRSDVFLADLFTGALSIVSTSASGVLGNGDSGCPSISADGRYVAFQSSASNLVSSDTNSRADVFVKDTVTGAVRRVNTTSAGGQAAGGGCPSISADGRRVGFSSSANDLIPLDTNGVVDVFVKYLDTGAIERVSVGVNGQEGNDESNAGSTNSVSFLSGDGNWVVFGSYADTLVQHDTNRARDTFRINLASGPASVSRVDVTEYGVEADSPSYNESLCADGRFVVFQSAATNLVSGARFDGNHDIYVKDTVTGALAQVNIDRFGNPANGGPSGWSDSTDPAISADGRYIVFHSSATNLVSDDLNNAEDVFIVSNPLHPGN